MKTTIGKILGLALLTATYFGTIFNSSAQATRNFRPETNAPYALLRNPALTNSPTAVAMITEVLATTPAPMSVPVVSTTNNSEGGTYWTMQSPVPLPGDFFPDLPVYLLDSTNRTFLIDDRSVDYAALDAQLAAENATNGSEGLFHANDLTIDTNRLWLSVATNALPGSNQFNVVIHETVTGNYYDVLTKADLLLPTWAVETTVVGAAGNETPVTLEQNDRTNLFVWARDSIIPIYTQPLPQEVYSGDSVTFTVGAGGSGLFYQWTFNGTNIYGATGSSYTILDVNANNAGDYACIVHNADGSVTTQAATLTVDQGSGWPYDMSAIGQRQDYVFRSGVTYNITSPIQLFGATKIEAGAIIKFDYNGLYPCLQIMGTLDCEGTPYNPAVLTSVDDDTFGLAEQDSTGSPQSVFTGAPFLDLTYAGNVSLSNLRFRYADMAVGAPYYSRVDVWDCQFVQCYAGVVNEFGGTDGFHNVLFAGCHDAVAGDTNAYAIEMEQVTADVANVWDSTVSPSRLALTNTIVFGSVGSVSGYSAQNVTVAPDAANFQTNSAGNYYLAAASTLHQSGTTNISARLRTELQQKTTSPPLAFPQLMNLSGNLTLLPQAARYTNGLPDRGYYYDAIDYTVAFMTVSGNLTIEPGTVIGVRNEPITGQSSYTYWGLDLRENSSVVSHGMPNRPNIFTDIQTVQEQDEYACSSLIVPDFQGSSADVAPTMDFRFSKLYASAGNFAVWGGDWEFVDYGDNLASYNSLVNWTMRDCEVHGGRISLGLPNIQIDLTQYYGSGAVDWENNLFENVNINLNPATWWYNGVVNFDESLTARNNLFKGANWMALEPVPASAGNWTFTDNLFDGIDFQTDPAAPLDFDYNGYYPLPASQTLYNTLAYELSLTAGDSTALFSSTNDLGGLHEVFMDYALPYVSGTFGNYYLSTVTPLWQAGSRTAADADLTQYTTFINQGKDSASQPVNIGLHYVASTNALPLDTDGDGIPDYVEVENGTDPNNAMTDGMTNDIYNAAYDNVDLSGNGLVGRIKKALEIYPLAANNPLVLTQIITGEEPDMATFSIPVNYGVLTNSGSLQIYVDGTAANLQDCIIDTNNSNGSVLIWNTTYQSPGQHYVQAEFSINGAADELTHSVDFGMGLMAPFTSSNMVQFFEQTSAFDDSGTVLYATTPACPDANYTIELRDPNNLSNPHIRTITGTTSTGVIQENWDLTYDDGVTIFTNDAVDAVYSVVLLDPGNGTNTQRLNKTAGVTDGNFDVAYAYNPSPVLHQYGTFWEEMLGVVDTLLSPVMASGGNPNNYNSSFNRYDSRDFPGQPGIPGYLSDRSAATNLLGDFASGGTRNFYFYGHGSTTYIGDGQTNTTSPAYLSAGEVSRMLANSWSAKNGIKAKTPYRFVFLDGCETGKDNNWAHSFGIYDKGTNGLPQTSIGPQAFAGWDAVVGGIRDTNNVVIDDLAFAYGQTLNIFYDDWMAGEPLAACVADASDKAFPDPLPVKGNENYTVNGQPWRRDTANLKIIGYRGLTRSGLNSNYP